MVVEIFFQIGTPGAMLSSFLKEFITELSTLPSAFKICCMLYLFYKLRLSKNEILVSAISVCNYKGWSWSLIVSFICTDDQEEQRSKMGRRVSVYIG